MGKGKGGGNQQKQGFALNTGFDFDDGDGSIPGLLKKATKQGALLLFTTVLGVFVDKFGDALYDMLTGKKNSAPKPNFEEKQVRFGIRKSIETVADDLGRPLTKEDTGKVVKAFFDYEGNAPLVGEKGAICPMIAEMVKNSNYDPTPDDSDNDDGGDGDNEGDND